MVRVPLLFLRFIGVHCWQFGFLTAFLNFLLVLGSLIWNYLLKSRWNAKHLLYGQGACFDWSALKEFSELVLPKKRRRMKKVKVPELVLLYSRTSSNTLIFLVKIYWGLTLRTFREEQLADQFRYFNFSSYLVIFRADQSKNHPVQIKAQIQIEYNYKYKSKYNYKYRLQIQILRMRCVSNICIE